VWTEWLASYSGPKVNARKTLGNAAHPPIEDAPGSYVKEKAS
jgi:polyhydroxyalkanoate synthase